MSPIRLNDIERYFDIYAKYRTNTLHIPVHDTESALAVWNVNSHDGEHEEVCLLGCVVWLEVTDICKESAVKLSSSLQYCSGGVFPNEFDIHGSVHRRLLSRNTNKMQLCNGIYYSKVYWRLSMFRVAHRSSSWALNCICSLVYMPMWWLAIAMETASHHMGIYIPEAANTV
jgi:hypothetical protein